MLSFVVCIARKDQVVREILDFQNADYESISKAICSINWNDTLITYPDARDLYKFFVCYLHELMHEYIPKKKVTAEGIKIPEHILTLIQQKERLWKNIDKNEQIRTKYERVSQWQKKECNRYYANVEKKIIASGKVKDLYKYISLGIKDNSKPVTALVDENGSLVTSEKERAQLFARSFFSYFTTDNGVLPDTTFPNPVHAFPQVEIDVGMIVPLINKWDISYSRTSDP